MNTVHDRSAHLSRRRIYKGQEFLDDNLTRRHLIIGSRGSGAGLYYSDFYSLWSFKGTTPNFSAYMDLGTLAPATTPNWFDAYSPTTLKQYAAFGDATYALTDALKVDVGARVNHYDYRFSSCISGLGSGDGAATPSCSGLIALSSTSFNPKFNFAYTFRPDLMAYATASTGFRPGGGNAVCPTTGAAWGGAFQQQGYTNGKWPSTYEPDRVVSYEKPLPVTSMNGLKGARTGVLDLFFEPLRVHRYVQAIARI
jgi:iron complex outermembrane receptor protein